MKAYMKPQIEIIAFRADRAIAAPSSPYDYADDQTVPVMLYKIDDWSGNSPS